MEAISRLCAMSESYRDEMSSRPIWFWPNIKMKAIIAICLIAYPVALARSEDFKTVDGKLFENATISRVEPDGIVVITKSGVSKIYFVELPVEIQLRFHYDAQKAGSYTADENEKIAALERQRLAESRQRTEEREKYWGRRATPAPSQNNSLANGPSDLQGNPRENPTPAQGPRNCYIEVRDVLSGLEIQRNWEASWGSYDRDYFGRLILNIRLGTVGRTGGPMKIQWFWIGRPLIDINRLIVYGNGEKMVEVPARYFTECYAAAPVLKNHTLNLVALGERYVSGAQHDGWIVCASDSKGRVLAEKASSESLLSLFNNADRFSRLASAK
jgi:hypothetical protein